MPSVTIKDAIFDGAMDNYPTYEFCQHLNIRPFILLYAKSVIAMDKPKTGINMHLDVWVKGFDKGLLTLIESVCPNPVA